MEFYYKTDYEYCEEMKSYDEDFWYDHDEYEEEDDQCFALDDEKNKN